MKTLNKKQLTNKRNHIIQYCRTSPREKGSEKTLRCLESSWIIWEANVHSDMDLRSPGLGEENTWEIM